MTDYSITDLIDIDTLQTIQDGFSRFTGFAVVAVDADGKNVTRPSGSTYFCSSLVKKTVIGKYRCQECVHYGALDSLSQKSPVIYKCHAGLTEFTAPILINDKIIGSIVCGQILPSDFNEEQLKKYAQELKLDPAIFVEEAKNTKIKTPEEIETAANFINEVTQSISKMAQKNLKTLERTQKLEKGSRAQFLYVSQMATDLKKDMSRWYTMLTQATKSQDLPKIKEDLKDILTKSTELYSMVEDSVGYIQLTEGKIELEEGVYDIRERLDLLMDAIKKIPSYRHLNIDLKYSSAVPQLLFGDSGRIGQLVSRLLFDVIHNSRKHDFKVYIDCHKQDYAQMLEIHISEPGNLLSEEQIEEINQYLKVSTARIKETKIISGMGLPVISMLVEHLNGIFDINNTATGTEFLLRIPQLYVKEENSNGF